MRDLIDLAAAARGLDLKRFRNAARGGDHLSRLLGRGMEFDEARPYQPGDDPRNIDWRVTARSGKPYTKVFREERERPVLFLTDLRRSMHFATRGLFKSVIAARLAVILAWAAEHGGDRVGGFLFSEDFHRELAPRAGRRGVLGLIHEFCAAPVWLPEDDSRATPESAVVKALRGVRKVGKSGSLLFFLSDGHHLDDDALTTLQDLGRNNDLVFVHIYDALEEQLPPPGDYLVKACSESARQLLSTKASAQSHREAFATHCGRLKDALARGRMRYVALRTDMDPAERLRDWFGAGG